MSKPWLDVSGAIRKRVPFVEEGSVLPRGLSYGRSPKGGMLVYFITSKEGFRIKLTKGFPWVSARVRRTGSDKTL